MMIDNVEADTLDASNETIDVIDIKAQKKELKPGQKAVEVRRRIEDHLENKTMREYFGMESNEEI